MRFAFALTCVSLALAAPLLPLEGRPGEVVTLLFQGEGEVVLPPGFPVLLPPESLEGNTMAVVQVPPLPAGEYPVRFQGQVYPFRVLPLERIAVLPPPPLELAPGEEGEAVFLVRNLGNVPLAPSFRAVALGARLVRLEPPPGPLAPGEEGKVRVRVRGERGEGRVLLYAPGAQAEARLVPRLTPLPPFHDWARVPSRLLWDSAQGLALEGRGALLEPQGRPLGQLYYRLGQSALFLDLSTPLYGVGVGLSSQVQSLSLRYLPSPFALTLSGDTTGRLRFRVAYQEGALRLGGEVAYPWDYSLEGGYGVSGWSLAGRLGPSGASLEASARLENLLLSGGLATPGRGYIQGTLPLGGGVNAGLGYRFGDEGVVAGLLALPSPLGTLEGRVEYALGRGQWRFQAFHILSQSDPLYTPEHLALLHGRLSYSPESGLAYGLSLKGRLEALQLEGGVEVSPTGGQVRAQANLEALTLGASLGFAWGQGVTGFGLRGSLAFDLPLYPLALPALRVEARTPSGAYTGGLEVRGPEGVFLLPLAEGTGISRLAPGVYRVRPPRGFAFLEGGKLKDEVTLELREDRVLSLELVPALRVAFLLRYCPPDPKPGYTFGLPGVTPEELLRRTRVRLEGQGLSLLVASQEPVLVPPGTFRVGLEGPYPLEARGPLGEDLALWEAREGTHPLCLVPPYRPLQEQELETR